MVVKEAIITGAGTALVTGLILMPKKRDYRMLLLSGIVAAGISGLVMSYTSGSFVAPRAAPPAVSGPSNGTQTSLWPASRVSVGGYATEYQHEFYSYPGTIFVD